MYPSGSAQITVLIPLPLFYNQDKHGQCHPVEDEKFIVTADEISRKFGGGVLHLFKDESPKGFWWNKGILNQDELAVLEVDIFDTDGNRKWIKSYARDVLLKRFCQDAIYIKFIGPIETLEVTEETITS